MFDYQRVIDISQQVVPEGTEERPFVISRSQLADRTFKYEVETHTHVGTHVEFPSHFFDGGKSGESYGPEKFMGPALLLRVRLENGSAITPAYLEKEVGAEVAEGDILLFQDCSETKPYFTPEAAEWMAERKLKMIGFDAIELGEDVEKTRELHRILLGKDILIIEFLAHLDDIESRRFYFTGFPLRVKGLDSSWIRALAFEQ